MTTPKNPASVAPGEQWRYRDGSISTVLSVDMDRGMVRDMLTWGDGSTGGPFENTIKDYVFHLSTAVRIEDATISDEKMSYLSAREPDL